MEFARLFVVLQCDCSLVSLLGGSFLRSVLLSFVLSIVPCLVWSFARDFASGGSLSFGCGLVCPAEQCCVTTCYALRCLAMFA